jgi:lipoprotein NlpI
LTEDEQGRLVRKYTDNMEAYDYYLRGLEYFSKLTKETNILARQMLQRAIDLDPQFAAAYALLGLATVKSGPRVGARIPSLSSMLLNLLKRQ